MRLALPLAIVLTTGCNAIFGLESGTAIPDDASVDRDTVAPEDAAPDADITDGRGSPDAPIDAPIMDAALPIDAVACVTGPDEDGDGKPDACDPCPIQQNEPADSDGDGVAGDCDPAPGLPGDHVAFWGFTDPAPTGWSTSGPWNRLFTGDGTMRWDGFASEGAIAWELPADATAVMVKARVARTFSEMPTNNDSYGIERTGTDHRVGCRLLYTGGPFLEWYKDTTDIGTSYPASMYDATTLTLRFGYSSGGGNDTECRAENVNTPALFATYGGTSGLPFLGTAAGFNVRPNYSNDLTVQWVLVSYRTSPP